MKQLIIFRHAKTELWYPEVEDASRALVSRGLTDTKLVAEFLLSHNIKVDRAIVSSSRRTRETWNILSEYYISAQMKIDDDLYLASLQDIENAIYANDEIESLMLVGHNPGFHDFAYDLMSKGGSMSEQMSSRLSARFPTGCAAVFSSEKNQSFDYSSFKLSLLVRPKDLRGEVRPQ